MTVKIRLARAGAKKRPFYRIVVSDGRSPRDGRFIERLGTYNPVLPSENEQRVVLKEERLRFWLERGAVPTERVARFLGQAQILQYKPGSNPKKGQPKAKAQERMKAAQEAAEAAEAGTES